MPVAHKPYGGVSTRVAPKNVGRPVAIEIPRPDDGPVRWHIADRRGGKNGGAIHQPRCHVATGVAPQEVAPIVAVEVTGTNDRPACRDVSNTFRCHHLTADADEPNR